MAEKEKEKEKDAAEEARRHWQVAKAAIVAQLPSAQLARSATGIALGRKNMAKDRQRRKSTNFNKSIGVSPERRPTSAGHMEMRLMHEAQKRGLQADMDGDGDVDELDKLQQIDLIREMPVPLHAKREMRDRMLKTMPEYEGSGCSAWLYRRRAKAYLASKRSKRQWNEIGQYITLWGSAFKKIEGQQGSTILTYFTFLKWLFIVNLVIFFMILLFVVIPAVSFPHEAYNSWVIANTTSSAVTSADTCSATYIANITTSTDPADLILNFIDGSGWMENTALFYGFYPNKLVTITSTYGYNIPVAYLVVMLMYLLISLILIVQKTSKGFRERLFSGANDGSQFCNLIFAAWDYNIQDAAAANLRYKIFQRSVTGELRERERIIKIKSRTNKEKAKLYSIRILVNLLILASLAGSAYLIYFSTVKTVEIESSSDYKTYHRVVQLLVQYLTSITITVLNAILPTVYKKIVNFEHYSPSGAVSITLFRTVFLKLASLAILLVSIYTKVTCSPQDDCRVGTGTCSVVRCWETKVGQEIYKLTLTDLFVLVGVTFVVEFPRWLIVTKCSCKLAKKIPRQEFDISKEVLGLIYGQILLWFGSFFSPLIPSIAVGKLFIGFYIKYLASMLFYGPSTKPHSASDSDAFFMYVLLVAYVLCVLPIGYCIWMIPPSRGCGPFRLYDKMFDILNLNLTKYPQWVQDIMTFVQSSIFEFTAIVAFCIGIFYLSQIIRAYKGMMRVLKEQLDMESQDKKFLLERMQEMGASSPQKKAIYANNKQSTPKVVVARQPSIEEIVLPPV